MQADYKIEDNIYVKDTGVYGKSLFAKKDFKKDELVFVAFGTVTKKDSYYTIPISDDLYIDPQKPEGNISQFICHSCEPNLGVKERSMFVAMRDIKKDEEVTIDYAMIVPRFPQEYKGNLWPEWKCKCGRSTCRGTVLGYFDLPKEVQKQYVGYVSEYILEMDTGGADGWLNKLT